jgi:chromosome segregation ATPase
MMYVLTQLLTSCVIIYSELNPELMQELNMLRGEYARLKEFESQREADNVQRLMESCDDAKRLSERFKEQFISTKGQLEDTQQLLHESKAREAKLREEVAGWTERHRKLGEEMKEERIKSHKAALDMERKFNDAKKALSEKARADLKDLSDKLTIKLENERKQHKEKLDRLGVERDELEKHFSQQLTELREQSSSHLRSTKESMQRRIDDLEQSKKDALEVADKEKKAELEALTQRGKGVLREKLRSADEKAKKKIEEANAQKNAFKEQLTKLEQFHVDFEEKAKIKIAKKTQQIKLLESQNEAAAAANSELEEKMQKAERTSKELIGENDRLRRQIGSRGPGGASQTQLEELVSVCNSLREENRRLKESSETNLFSDSAIYEPSTSPADSGSSTLGLSKTALIEYRQEFEERIQALEDDKRDLIMRNSAAMSDVQKAEARSWELEEELSKVKGELTTAKLVMQRHERKAELMNLGSNSKARKRVSSGLIKENATPNIHKRDFTPTAIQSSNKKSRTDVPSLMDYAKNGAKSSEGEQPGDCKQS